MTDEKDTSVTNDDNNNDEKKEEVATEAPALAEDGAQEDVDVDVVANVVEEVKETVKEAVEGAKLDMTPAQKEFTDNIEKMSVLELNQLVKVLEMKFGVSAQAVAVATPGASEADGGDDQSSFIVELASVGDSKIGVIKAVKATLGLGLKEAKDLVESAPAVLKEGVEKAQAEEMKKALEEAGATVNLK